MSLPLSGLSFVPVPAALVANAVKQKPTKRSCTMAGCTNGVVQGGLCVSHGAKRRMCQFPGCTKSSKTAGMCSKHGPKRPPCDKVGCTSVSVRGTKCRAHAEPSKKCAVAGCRKARTIGDVCKHHQSNIAKAMLATSLPALPGMTSSLCMPVVQVPLSHVIAQQNMLASMGMAGLAAPYAYPPMFVPPSYGVPGMGLGLGGLGGSAPMGNDASAASRRTVAGERLTSDALMMLELAQASRSDNGTDNP